jgi:tRNA A37 threonylcarbamoyladenosine biosynthesis protein TsaE
VVVVEWADRLEGWLPAERLEIELVPLDSATARAIRWRATGAAHLALAAAALGRP